MRLWSDEHRLGTLELLMTLPISPWQAIVGKFLAAWLFLAIALAGTFPLIVTVNWLGDPDNGVIASGYVGALLVAGMYLAIASFCSALTRNQAVAFVLSLILCLLFALAGSQPVVDLLARWGGVGLMEVVAAMSVVVRFDGFQKGLVDLRDIVYFVSIAALALFVFGHGVLRDISFCFLVGIVTSTFSAIFIAAQVFYYWHKGDRKHVEAHQDVAPKYEWQGTSKAAE